MKLYVGNLPFTTTEDDLRNLFADFGEPTRITVVIDRMSGRSRGFGFVEYDDAAQGKAAIERLNGKDLGGRSLVVNEARPEGSGRGGQRGPRGGGGGYGGGFGGGGGLGGGRREDRGSGRRGPGGRRSDY